MAQRSASSSLQTQADAQGAVGRLLTTAAAVVLGELGLAAAAVAQASVPPGAMTPGRAGASVAALVGLISVIIGGLALGRFAGRSGTGNRRAPGIAALVVGLTGIVLGARHLIRYTGGFGTGDGRAGALVALAVGLIGMILGGLALRRSRRTG